LPINSSVAASRAAKFHRGAAVALGKKVAAVIGSLASFFAAPTGR
jgi:hypothetical protein